MKYINHITLNTGHMRKTYPNEIDKELYFKLKRIYNDSFKNDGVEILDGYKVKSTNSEYGVLSTVFSKNDVPILTTAISNTDYDGYLWKTLHSSSMLPVETNAENRADLPYIADRLEIGAIESLNAMKWTGDFSRCMGWIILAPNKIR